MQPALGMACRQEFRNVRLENRSPATPKVVDLRRHWIDAGHGVAVAQQAGNGYQLDVTRPEYCDVQS
jgi:hypothetical protein